MTESAEDAIVAPKEGGVSRRRILVGAAWATPAVLVATAVPAAANSTDPEQTASIPGDLVIIGASAVYVSGLLTVTEQIAYAGVASAAPIVGTTATMAFEQWGMPAQTPTAVSAGWQFQGPATTANNKITFTFVYIGVQVSAADPAPAALKATFANWQTSATTVVETVTGTSLSVPINKSTTIAAKAIALAPTFAHGGAIDWQEWFSSNPKTSAYRFNAALRWTGPHNPQGADITGLAVAFRIPANRTDGTLISYGSGMGSGWTLVGGQGSHEGSYWYFRFTYAGSIGSSVLQTTGLQFAVKSTATPTAGTVQYTIAGTSAGVPLVTTGTAP